MEQSQAGQTQDHTQTHSVLVDTSAERQLQRHDGIQRIPEIPTTKPQPSLTPAAENFGDNSTIVDQQTSKAAGPNDSERLLGALIDGRRDCLTAVTLASVAERQAAEAGMDIEDSRESRAAKRQKVIEQDAQPRSHRQFHHYQVQQRQFPEQPSQSPHQLITQLQTHPHHLSQLSHQQHPQHSNLYPHSNHQPQHIAKYSQLQHRQLILQQQPLNHEQQIQHQIQPQPPQPIIASHPHQNQPVSIIPQQTKPDSNAPPSKSAQLQQSEQDPVQLEVTANPQDNGSHYAQPNLIAPQSSTIADIGENVTSVTSSIPHTAAVVRANPSAIKIVPVMASSSDYNGPWVRVDRKLKPTIPAEYAH